MKTATICIGNTDNKLTQQEWSRFCHAIKQTIDFQAATIYFVGGTDFMSANQSACWVIGVWPQELQLLRANLKQVREKYNQDSVALVVGDTEFV